MDARLASYLLDPTGRDHSLAQTARERISCELPALKELCERSGKGKKATPLAEVPVDEVGAAACALAEGRAGCSRRRSAKTCAPTRS